MVIHDSKPTIKSSTIDNIIENFGFMNPIIRKKRCRSPEVYKIINNIQYCGPQILKATEELITKVDQHQKIVEEDAKQLEKKYAKEKEELKNQVKYLKKIDKRHSDESSMRIQRLVDELKWSKSQCTLLNRKLQLTKMGLTNQKEMEDDDINVLYEYQEMRKFIVYCHNNLLKIEPKYREHAEYFPTKLSCYDLMINVFEFIKNKNSIQPSTNVENPEVEEEPVRDGTNLSHISIPSEQMSSKESSENIVDDENESHQNSSIEDSDHDLNAETEHDYTEGINECKIESENPKESLLNEKIQRYTLGKQL